MESTRRTGRIVGVLLLLHLAIGLMTPFILLDRVRGSEGLLANAAASPVLFRSALLLLIAGSSIAIFAALAAAPLLRRHGERTALALVTLAAVAFALQVVDTGALMAILALSRERAGAAVPSEIGRTLGAVATAARLWLHYSYLVFAVSWVLLLNAALFRFRLVPTALAAAGVAACVLQLAGVSIPGLLGVRPVFALALPMAPAYLGVAGWLIAKGFAAPAGTDGARLAA